MTPPTPLTSDTFDEFIRTYRVAVIHFWAEWNGVDVRMRGVLETLIPEDLRGQITFASFDIDLPAHEALCHQHNVRTVPFLAFYRDGALVRSVAGMRPPEVMIGYLQELVSDAEA